MFGLFGKKQATLPVIKDFDTQRYLGTWYEIARMDYFWEKGLSKVTATYSLNADGSIRVDNKGYDEKKEKWKESIGKAKPADTNKNGKLNVSFFGPFYAAYNVIAIDPAYEYALVIGSSPRYMWILARKPSIPVNVKSNYLNIAAENGVETDKLVWVKH